MIKKIKGFMQSRSLKKWEWIVLAGVMILFSSLYMYNDIVHTSARGLAFWSSLFAGELSNYYLYPYPAVEDSIIASVPIIGGAYDFIIYFIFALYDLPAWVWEKITGLSVFSFYPTRLYIKGITWLFSAFAGYMVYKIAMRCGLDKNKAKWSAFIFLSSGLFVYSEVAVGGYDIISVAFSLLGIYGFLNKNNKCFIVSFGIAMACKLFAVWLFIPLLLLREKRISRLMLNAVGAFSFIVVPKIYFIIAPKVHAILAHESVPSRSGPILPTTLGSTDIISHSNIIDRALFDNDNISPFVGSKTLPLVFVGMFIIWILCYFHKKAISEKQVIYVCAVAMSVFVLAAVLHPYWIVLIAPYIALLISFDLDNYDKNAILDILISVGFVCRTAVYYYGCGSLGEIYSMLQPKELIDYKWTEDHPVYTYGINKVIVKLASMTGISSNNVAGIFGALFVASILLFLYMNYPREKAQSEEPDFAKIRLYTYLRVAVAVFIGMFPIWGYIFWKIDG